MYHSDKCSWSAAVIRCSSRFVKKTYSTEIAKYSKANLRYVVGAVIQCFLRNTLGDLFT